MTRADFPTACALVTRAEDLHGVLDVGEAVGLADRIRPPFHRPGCDLGSHPTGTAHDVVVVALSCATPVEQFSGVVTQHVNLACVSQQLQRTIDRSETYCLAASADCGMDVLSRAETFLVGESSQHRPSLAGVASWPRGHGAHYATAGTRRRRLRRALAHIPPRTTTYAVKEIEVMKKLTG